MQPQTERNPKADLHLLLQAKAMSDGKNYHEKNKILRDLFMSSPDDFLIDSDLNKKFVGVTHVPTSFKIHAPRDIIPYTVKRQEALNKISSDLSWSYVPELVNTYTSAAKSIFEKVARALLPSMRAWVNPTNDKVLVDDYGVIPSRDVSTALEKSGVHYKIGRPNLSRPWIMVKSSSTTISSVLGPIAQAFAIKPSSFTDAIGGATPLASMIAGGALTAGLGYGAGALAETFAPEVFEKGKLRKRLAVLGGALGALPGAALGGIGMSNWDDPANPDRKSSPFNAFIRPNVLFGNSNIKQASDSLSDIQPHISDEMQKAADFFGGNDSLHFAPIPVDAFNRMVMADPFAQPYMQAATMGIVGAANSLNGGSGFITPMDIARIGMGMGAGYVQATIGGKVLGALAGLTPQAQRTLQGAGVIAGAMKAVVPGLFGH